MWVRIGPEPFDHPCAFRAAIDDVAEKDDARLRSWIGVNLSLDSSEEIFKET